VLGETNQTASNQLVEGSLSFQGGDPGDRLAAAGNHELGSFLDLSRYSLRH
jgi:hypothetical protein